ncbi:MAG: deoxyguanosinetriphosphate triphosphohydrolase [Clostridiales Family XIII bacterium]|jgi:dGTPase|nr:deoxyguanosinetriphosphate triphosphohydrolase [Clostridiales Family XIII bacterium]
MLARLDSEKREFDILSEYATRASGSKGRERSEEKCGFRTDFQRDRDRIIHAKAFRRLMHKTQVFLAPEGDHFRTRLTHTLEVNQISRSIARALRLNEDLTEAISLGHDLGHTPFGHSGEDALANVHRGGFRHNVQSLRVVDVLEGHYAGGRGMNLTWEVRDGIVNHTGETLPATPEGMIVRVSDRIAYINHDIDDALRSGILMESDLPKECVSVLGDSTKKRIDSLIRDMIVTTDREGEVKQSEAFKEATDALRAFMFENVYYNSKVKKEGGKDKVGTVIKALYEYYLHSPEDLPPEPKKLMEEFDVTEVVKDHIASMTDRFARNTYLELFVPSGFIE